MDRFSVLYNALWPLKSARRMLCDVLLRCSLRCDSVPAGYERLSGGRWRCSPGFHGTVVKGCEPRGGCREALKLQGCSQLIPCAPLVVKGLRIKEVPSLRWMSGSSVKPQAKLARRVPLRLTSYEAE